MGSLVGAGELIARYRDAPFATLRSPAALAYMLFNAAASISALSLVRLFGWKFGLADASDVVQSWVQVLVAGFGAMALFRSSLFVVRIGREDVGVGPSAFLQVLLIAVNREVDRRRATYRASAVIRIMKGIVFDKAQIALPSTCIALMQDLSASEQQEISKAVLELRASAMESGAKVLALGLLLMNYVGKDVLEQAIKSLAGDIR